MRSCLLSIVVALAAGLQGPARAGPLDSRTSVDVTGVVFDVTNTTADGDNVRALPSHLEISLARRVSDRAALAVFVQRLLRVEESLGPGFAVINRDLISPGPDPWSPAGMPDRETRRDRTRVTAVGASAAWLVARMPRCEALLRAGLGLAYFDFEYTVDGAREAASTFTAAWIPIEGRFTYTGSLLPGGRVLPFMSWTGAFAFALGRGSAVSFRGTEYEIAPFMMGLAFGVSIQP